MISKPITLAWDDVEAISRQSKTVVWATSRAAKTLPWPDARWISECAPLADVRTVIAIGGGSHLDKVKLSWRFTGAKQLIAVPTIWGSGAEASPVAVWREGEQKCFKICDSLRPDAMAFCPLFMASLSPSQINAACGDAWAHALEGFLSPLASHELRAELALIIKGLLSLPFSADARWFPLSASACAGQSQSSVGLVHGLAHVLESRLYPVGLGHAALCSALLWPVLMFNSALSNKFEVLAREHGLDTEEIFDRIASLSDLPTRRMLTPHIEHYWRDILRDPCTRTNSVLVRPDGLRTLIEFLEKP